MYCTHKRRHLRPLLDGCAALASGWARQMGCRHPLRPFHSQVVPDPGTPWGATCGDRDRALGMGERKGNPPDASSAFCDVIAVTKNRFMLGKTQI